MRNLLLVAVTLAFLPAALRAEALPREAPGVVLKSPDGKKVYDLAKLTNEGPVLVRLTCACSGCDQELPYFQKLQAAYHARGLRTLAIFREKPETASSYAARKDLRFPWVADPKGEMWKTFDARAMPTNILIAKGGRVVKVVAGCARDGQNAQVLSAEIAKLLDTDEAPVAKTK